MSDTAPPAGKDLSRGSLPVVIVAALLSAVLGAGVTYGAAKSELHETAKAAAEAKATAQKAVDDVHTHEVNLAVLNTQMTEVKASLERIERAVGSK